MITKTVIVGTKHLHDAAAALLALAALRKGDAVELRREPKNKVDPGAVAVYIGEQQIGYIPMKVNGPIGAALDAGCTVTAGITLEAIIQGGQVIRDGLPHITILSP